MTNHSFGFYGLTFFSIILLRSFLIAGCTYWCFYGRCGQSISQRQLRPPSHQAMQRDMQLAVVAAWVFALAAAFVLSSYSSGLTRLYSQAQQYGLWYLGVSYGVVLLLQDTYFYFTHRLLHHPAFFPWCHQGHHRASEPTPWTAFAFDPLEAFVHALFFVGLVFVIPLHFITLIAVLTTMTVWAVLNHLALERLPRSFPHHWLGKWLIGPAHHARHHRQYTLHYGLYFTFWDKLLGTQDPLYEQKLGNVAQQGGMEW